MSPRAVANELLQQNPPSSFPDEDKCEGGLDLDLEGQGPKEILPFAFSRLLMLTKASLDLLNEKLKGLLRIPKTQTAKDDDAIVLQIVDTTILLPH